jgi:hypothetical protein
MIEHPTKSNSKNPKKLDFQHTFKNPIMFNVKKVGFLDFLLDFCWIIGFD